MKDTKPGDYAMTPARHLQALASQEAITMIAAAQEAVTRTLGEQRRRTRLRPIASLKPRTQLSGSAQDRIRCR